MRYPTATVREYRTREPFRLSDASWLADSPLIKPIARVVLGKAIRWGKLQQVLSQVQVRFPETHNIDELDPTVYELFYQSVPKHELPTCRLVRQPEGNLPAIYLRDCVDYPTHSLAVVGNVPGYGNGYRGYWGPVLPTDTVKQMTVLDLSQEDMYGYAAQPPSPPTGHHHAMQFALGIAKILNREV